MNSVYQQFQFRDYQFDHDTKQLSLHYGYDDALSFTETYQFDFDFVDYDAAALDRAIQLLFFMAGVSYYKAFLAPEIIVQKGQIDAALASFLNKTYQKGLGELLYINQLDPLLPVDFPINSQSLPTIPVENPQGGKLVGLGGGKDSLVTIEILRQAGVDFTTWSLNHERMLAPLVERVGVPHYAVHREWDRQLLDLRDNPDAYNGHVPISAIFACVGTVMSILSGQRDVVVSNESSANEPTLTYQGQAINHQYSKSSEFEQDFQAILKQMFGEGVRYYSFLRPYTEVRIAERFAQLGFERYKDVFTSCNRAFVHGSELVRWDRTCPKCAFVFLALTPFVAREKLEALFSGDNLLLKPDLESTYRQLLGIEGNKPLECIGEVKESRAAMRLAQATYPELSKYEFELPDDYDFRALSRHDMPPEVFELLER